MEPVVNIIADGKLAYTGFLSLAAKRQGVSEDTLARAIERGWQLDPPLELMGALYATTRPRSYTAHWRDGE